MKEITFLSGKGGTGKTSVTAAIASVAQAAIFCDNDVDAADLHLIFHPEIMEENQFYGAWLPIIDQDKCTGCRRCMDLCRFDAIHPEKDKDLTINTFQCEGCRLCERICTVGAITSKRSNNNQWFVSDTRFGTLVHAKMGPGEENSGKLVAKIRNKTKEIAMGTSACYIINDGPPGIGCAAISSLSGIDLAVIVTEPSKSGFHDAKRLYELISTFNIPACAIINKHDMNPAMSREIEEYLKIKNIQLLANIPFDKIIVEAMLHGKTIVEYSPGSVITRKIKEIWEQLK